MNPESSEETSKMFFADAQATPRVALVDETIRRLAL